MNETEVITGTIRSYEGHAWGDSERAALAVRWKAYYAEQIKDYIGEVVLEVGAGLGSNVPYLWSARRKSWVCLEPDPELTAKIPQTLSSQPWRERVEARTGILQDLSEEPVFDTILYIDVLEHIERDAVELVEALKRLKVGGHIIVLSPACPSLYTVFDECLGHFRRYDKEMLRACTPPGSKMEKLFYLDSIGVLASIANKLFLKQNSPTDAQVLLWDRYMVPVSRVIDPLIGFRIGKSILGVWTKTEA